MPKGAPKGNQYAVKEPSERRRGLTVSHYIRADILEYFRDFLEYETGNGSDEAVRKRISELIEQAINEDMSRIFALYKLRKGQKDDSTPIDASNHPRKASPKDSSVDR